MNPVLEALKAGRVKELHVGPRGGERMAQLLAVASQHGVRVQRVLPEVLDRESRHGVHQGVVARVDEPAEYNVEDLVRTADGPPLIVVLDGIEDPHNLGAILRTCDAAGVHGVVIQSRRSAALSGAAAKAAAGALSHVRIAEVVNVARAVEELKEANLWTVGQGLVTRRLMPKPQAPPKRSSRTPPKEAPADDGAASVGKAAQPSRAPASGQQRVKRRKKKGPRSRR